MLESYEKALAYLPEDASDPTMAGFPTEYHWVWAEPPTFEARLANLDPPQHEARACRDAYVRFTVLTTPLEKGHAARLQRILQPSKITAFVGFWKQNRGILVRDDADPETVDEIWRRVVYRDGIYREQGPGEATVRVCVAPQESLVLRSWNPAVGERSGRRKDPVGEILRASEDYTPEPILKGETYFGDVEEEELTEEEQTWNLILF